MRKTYFSKCSVTLALLIVLSTFSGCTPSENNGASAGVVEATPWHYIIPTETADILVDQDGNEIMRGEHLNLLTSYVTVTISAPRYVSSYTYLKEDDVDVHGDDFSSTLYSVDGTLLLPTTQGRYVEAFGDYVIHTNLDSYYYEKGVDKSTYYSNLINVTTGEIVYENIRSAEPLSNGLYALRQIDETLLGIVDVNASEVFGFPLEKYFDGFYPHGDYYSTWWRDPTDPNFNSLQSSYFYTILNSQFEPILPEDDQISRISYIAGPYFLIGYHDGATQAFNADTQELVGSMPTLSYFDGEIYFFHSEELYDTHYRENYVMGKYNENDPFPIAASMIRYYDDSGDNAFPIPNTFAFIDFFTNDICVIDRDGTITASIPSNALGMYFVSPNRIIASSLYVDGTRLQGHHLLNDDLQVLTDPSSNYEDIYQSQNNPYLVAYTYHPADDPADDIRFFDLLDFDGNVLVADLQSIIWQTDDRLVVEWNGEVGLIDYYGNWVYKVDPSATVTDA